MIPRLITSGVLAAIAGAAMAFAVSSSPSFAFTLSSPTVTEEGLKTDIQQVYYYRRYYYRPYCHHYYHPYYHHYYRRITIILITIATIVLIIIVIIIIIVNITTIHTTTTAITINYINVNGAAAGRSATDAGRSY